MNKAIDLVDQKFGKLVVIKEAYRKKNVYWRCLCDCGNETIVIGTGLRNGHTTSCGCSRIDGAIKTAKKMLSLDPRQTSARHIYINSYKDGNLSLEQFLLLSQQPCHYCGTTSDKSNLYNKYKNKISTTVLQDISLGDFLYNGLDRIDNTKPHDFDNVVPCCKWCNSAKMDRTYAQFIAWIEQVSETIQKRKGP